MINESSIKQRVKDILSINDSNPTRLAKRYSVNQKTLNNQINSDVQMSASTILLIMDAFPDISAEWLLRGEGEMKKSTSSNLEIIEELKAENNMLRGENRVLREQLGLGARKESKGQST